MTTVTRPRTLREVRTWSSTTQGRKLIRFAMVSVISTVVSEVTILVVYGCAGTHSPMWSTAIGNLVAMLPAYYLTRRWAWGKTGASHWRKEVVPYVSINILGMGVSLIGATYCRHIVYTHHLSHLVNTALVGGVNLVSFGVFWFLKVLLFNRIFHLGATPSFDADLREQA